jgi:HSP20 family molecular chaperone IbpA
MITTELLRTPRSVPVIRGGSIVPRYNCKTGQSSVVYEIALAGFTRSDIRVELSSTSLNVSSDTTRDYSEYVIASTRVSPFSLSFPVPAGSEVESAVMRDGLLTVTIRTANTRTIPVT